MVCLSHRSSSQAECHPSPVQQERERLLELTHSFLTGLSVFLAGQIEGSLQSPQVVMGLPVHSRAAPSIDGLVEQVSRVIWCQYLLNDGNQRGIQALAGLHCED